jgi:hypothetical protein
MGSAASQRPAGFRYQSRDSDALVEGDAEDAAPATDSAAAPVNKVRRVMGKDDITEARTMKWKVSAGYSWSTAPWRAGVDYARPHRLHEKPPFGIPGHFAIDPDGMPVQIVST